MYMSQAIVLSMQFVGNIKKRYTEDMSVFSVWGCAQ